MDETNKKEVAHIVMRHVTAPLIGSVIFAGIVAYFIKDDVDFKNVEGQCAAAAQEQRQTIENSLAAQAGPLRASSPDYVLRRTFRVAGNDQDYECIVTGFNGEEPIISVRAAKPSDPTHG